MISDQDRKLAEDTFDLIERSNPEIAPMITPAPSPLEVRRQAIIKGLRDMADALEAHPELPAPFDVELNAFWRLSDKGSLDGRLTVQDARAAMAAAPGGWSKNAIGNYLEYRREFSSDVALIINLQRADVCKRVQVGTRTVPAREEPVYEWDCSAGDEPDVSMALAEHTAPALDVIEQAGR